jgi:hypothetical protein
MMKPRWCVVVPAPFVVQTSTTLYVETMGKPTGTRANWLSPTRASRIPFASVTTANADIDIHLVSDGWADFLLAIKSLDNILNALISL